MGRWDDIKGNWEAEHVIKPEDVEWMIEQVELTDQCRKDWLAARKEADNYKKVAILSMGGQP